MLSAGLVDLQVNGFAGVDFNSTALTPDALDHALDAMLRTGVTTCLPTLITASEAALAARLAALDAAVADSRLGPLMVPGYHLEGPFLSARDGYTGCHPPEAMVAPNAGLIERIEAGLRRPILLLTLAPELAGAEALIRWCRARGKIVALGHTAAGPAEIAAAVAAGATLSTHLGNAAARIQHKFDNPITAQLAEDGLAASFIADGLHVPPFALKAMIRAKGFSRSILVTDATAAAAAPAGRYDFAGMTVERTAAGEVRAPCSAVLAGSALTLDQAVRNLAVWGIAGADEAIRMASDHPARALHPALEAHGAGLPHTQITWSDGLTPSTIRLHNLMV
ncbi:MAG: amidohydrolase family protein [Alphaproteobacteria bacterium]|nr:amidohydrolase family protein [Alphaproteobacteria bacterium]